MTREEAIKILKVRKDCNSDHCPSGEVCYKCDEAFDMAIKALKQEPSTDTVSRQEIYDELEKWEWQELYLPIHFKENIVDVIPSVTPTRPKGQWINVASGSLIDDYRCSECNNRPPQIKWRETWRWNFTAFCPHCGAKMENEVSKCM